MGTPLFFLKVRLFLVKRDDRNIKFLSIYLFPYLKGSCWGGYCVRNRAWWRYPYARRQYEMELRSAYLEIGIHTAGAVKWPAVPAHCCGCASAEVAQPDMRATTAAHDAEPPVHIWFRKAPFLRSISYWRPLYSANNYKYKDYTKEILCPCLTSFIAYTLCTQVATTLNKLLKQEKNGS